LTVLISATCALLVGTDVSALQSPPTVLSQTWTRYSTPLKQPPGLGGQAWSGFGVCRLTLDKPGTVEFTWKDTQGKPHTSAHHFTTTTGTIILHQDWWTPEPGLPPFMTEAEIVGK
jgi:hypothetical protein